MRKFMFVMSMALAALLMVSCDDDYNAPQSMRDTLLKQYPGAVDVEWERRRGHAVADFHLPGVSNDCEAWYTLDGVWVMTQFDIPYSELPKSVRDSFEGSYGTQTPVDDVKRLERNKQDTIYFIEATVVVNGFLADIYLDYLEDGTLLRTSVDVENYENVYYYL